ncbi:LPXTG cell wall anchor domain-containing protein [Streptomyces sp. NPDC020298]|uniref:LPXTG cell wall anchor domain-containing protein n=1 Tax=unclassified Streptomyces TaxID=2593676 RepID=UPI0033DB906E
MRNSRALAAACTAVAVLGLTAPVAVADGMGNGGVTSSNDLGGVSGVVVDPFAGQGRNNFGNQGHHNFGNQGRNNLPGNGNFPGNGNIPGSGNIPGNGTLSSNGVFPGSGTLSGNGTLQGTGNNLVTRNIVASPSAIAPGGRLTVTVDGCNGGSMTSPAFGSAVLTAIGNNVSRGIATVNSGTRPGADEIRVNCNGRTLTNPTAFTVIGGVLGGVGGSSTSGATAADMAIGGTLVGAAVIGGGLYVLRRRNEKRI